MEGDGDRWVPVAEVFFQDQARRGLSSKHLRLIRHVVRRFLTVLQGLGVDEPAALEAEHLEVWEESLLECEHRRYAGQGDTRRLGPSTRHHYTSMVLQLVEFLVRRDYLLVDPRSYFQRSRCLGHLRLCRSIPTATDVRRLLDSIEGRTPREIRDRALLELLYSSGIRAGEARHLDVCDVNLAEGEIQVREGKGGKDRRVPIGVKARETVAVYLDRVRPAWWRSDSGSALFLQPDGRRIYESCLSYVCRWYGALAGMPKVTPHGLRHACATHLLIGGADIRHIQEILGHRRLQTTERYTHLVPLDLVEVHRRCHPRGSR